MKVNAHLGFALAIALLLLPVACSQHNDIRIIKQGELEALYDQAQQALKNPNAPIERINHLLDQIAALALDDKVRHSQRLRKKYYALLDMYRSLLAYWYDHSGYMASRELFFEKPRLLRAFVKIEDKLVKARRKSRNSMDNEGFPLALIRVDAHYLVLKDDLLSQPPGMKYNGVKASLFECRLKDNYFKRLKKLLIHEALLWAKHSNQTYSSPPPPKRAYIILPLYQRFNDVTRFVQTNSDHWNDASTDLLRDVLGEPYRLYAAKLYEAIKRTPQGVPKGFTVDWLHPFSMDSIGDFQASLPQVIEQIEYDRFNLRPFFYMTRAMESINALLDPKGSQLGTTLDSVTIRKKIEPFSRNLTLAESYTEDPTRLLSMLVRLTIELEKNLPATLKGDRLKLRNKIQGNYASTGLDDNFAIAWRMYSERVLPVLNRILIDLGFNKLPQYQSQYPYSLVSTDEIERAYGILLRGIVMSSNLLDQSTDDDFLKTPPSSDAQKALFWMVNRPFCEYTHLSLENITWLMVHHFLNRNNNFASSELGPTIVYGYQRFLAERDAIGKNPDFFNDGAKKRWCEIHDWGSLYLRAVTKAPRDQTPLIAGVSENDLSPYTAATLDGEFENSLTQYSLAFAAGWCEGKPIDDSLPPDIEPEPPTPEPDGLPWEVTPEPTPEPDDTPEPEDTPEPTPVPEDTPEPTPVPTPVPTPEPTPEPTPVPTPTPIEKEIPILITSVEQFNKYVEVKPLGDGYSAPFYKGSNILAVMWSSAIPVSLKSNVISTSDKIGKQYMKHNKVRIGHELAKDFFDAHEVSFFCKGSTEDLLATTEKSSKWSKCVDSTEDKTGIPIFSSKE